MIKQNYKNKKVINLLVTTLAILVFMSIYGKVYARYILTREFNTDISSAQFYFGVDSVSSNITIQKRPNNTLLTSPKFDLVIHNNDGNNYNSYDVTYNISIVDSENIYFENEVTKTIVGGSKKDENVSINFNIKDIDNIQDTVTIRVTTTKPYSKSVDIKFNIKTEWVIQKIEDLVDFSNKVNEGKTYEGEQVVLLNNLDFNTPSDYENANRLDYHDYNDDGVEEALIDELRKGRGFIPIGYRTEVNNEGEAIDRQEFKGNFDGQNYTISGLYINNNQQQYSTGLFGRTRNATIKNLTVEGNVTTTEYASVGGIIGVDHNSEITNCINRINVSVGMGRYQAAGIVSSANGSIIKNCVNYGNISEGNHTGGIAGIVNEGGAYIISCKNYGKISNSQGSTAIGGIIGHQSSATSGNIIIDDCHNYGIVTVDGNVKEEQKVGGIVGVVRAKAVITNSTNEGKIEGHTTNAAFHFNAGGIIGRIDAGHAIVRNCHNLGSITGEYRLGGIIGHINSGGTGYIIDCHNEGTLGERLTNKTSASASGGILGYGNNVHIYIINSYNKGEIHGYQAGGIIGTFDTNVSDSAFVMNSYNAGEITSNDNYAGGIFGHLNNAVLKVDNVYNIGDVSGISPEYTYSIGYINTTVSHVVNNVYYNEKYTSSNQSYGWTQISEADMKLPSFTETLNSRIGSIDVSEMKNKLISVGLADENYDIHTHRWEFDTNYNYSTIVNEHGD